MNEHDYRRLLVRRRLEKLVYRVLPITRKRAVRIVKFLMP